MYYLLKEMATKSKTGTKKDLEVKIAELEAKLTKLASQLEAKPAEVKPAKTKPAEVKPAETKPKATLPKGTAEVKPAEVKPATTKPKPTLPKGTAEVKPAEAPKPAETTSQAPATVQEALENAYMNAAMTDFHKYRANVTGYTPPANRYFVRLTAPVGTVPTTNWNDQKVKTPGYTQPSNQYFATRPRLAYSPPGKTFVSFSGIDMVVEGVTKQAPEPQKVDPPKPKGTLPKGTAQAPPPQTSSTYTETKSKKQELEDYEKDYMNRIEQERIADEKAYREMIAAEAKAKASTQQSRGTLPKGFEPKPEPETPKSSKGTLPKGF